MSRQSSGSFFSIFFWFALKIGVQELINEKYHFSWQLQSCKLKRSMMTIESFACNFCEKSFSKPDHLQNHIDLYHSYTALQVEPNESVEKDEDLEEVFAGKAIRLFDELKYKEKNKFLEDLKKDHSNDSGFTEGSIIEEPVNQRNEGYLKSSDQLLEAPEKIQMGRCYSCKFCNKSFLRQDCAREHEMIHTGERPFKCNYCEKLFRRLRDAKQHP